MSAYFCTYCNTSHAIKLGRCHMCGSWNCIEQKEEPPKFKNIKPRSKKGQARHKSKSDVYSIIDSKAIAEDRFYCWGCGGNCGALSHSHLIPGDKFLAVIENIWLMGYGNKCSCHDLWETHHIDNIVKIPNYMEALEVVRMLHKEYYYKLVNKD